MLGASVAGAFVELGTGAFVVLRTGTFGVLSAGTLVVLSGGTLLVVLSGAFVVLRTGAVFWSGMVPALPVVFSATLLMGGLIPSPFRA